MRVIFMKCLINTEMDFELLTEQEQIDLIEKLIKDHKLSYPYSTKELILVNNEYNDGSLDW